MLGVAPHATEIAATVAGDDLVPEADIVMDRGFTLPGTPEQAWPWFTQLGKNRAGWYLPHRLELVIPRRRRALRRIDPALQNLKAGDIIDDWGGAGATFEIVIHDAPSTLVHRSTRGHLRISWAILLHPTGNDTRVHLRFRMSGARHRRLVELGGGLIDLFTVAGLAAGLRERLANAPG